MTADPATEPTSPPVGPDPGPDQPRREPFAPRTLLADAAVAGVVVAGLYGLLYAVPFPPFGVPGYLLIVAFDALEPVLPPFATAAAYDAAFAGFLAALALVASAAASRARAQSPDTAGPSGVRTAAGAALAVVGAVGLVVAAVVFAPYVGGQYVPLLLVAGTGLALVAAGRYVALGRVGRRSG